MPDLGSLGITLPEGSGNWWDQFLNTAGNSLSNIATNPGTIPAAATAIQQWNNANKYGELSDSIKQEGNPFGQYRQQYGQGLNDLYNDPSSVANSAAYKFRMSEGLNTLGPQLAAKGGGYGNATGSMMKYASDLASQEYDKEWQRRYEAAGGKIGPEASISGQTNLLNSQVNAQNGALQALGTLFGQQPSTQITNTGGNTTSGGSGGGSNPIGGGGLNSGSQLGATGTWDKATGFYKLADGTLIDVTKLSEAARAGNQEAIDYLTRISGGATVDEQIRNLGQDWDGGLTGDPYNPEVVIDDPVVSFPEITPTLEEWYDWGGN
jgi:hypothetical protein